MTRHCVGGDALLAGSPAAVGSNCGLLEGGEKLFPAIGDTLPFVATALGSFPNPLVINQSDAEVLEIGARFRFALCAGFCGNCRSKLPHIGVGTLDALQMDRSYRHLPLARFVAIAAAFVVAGVVHPYLRNVALG